jgi:sortase A
VKRLSDRQDRGSTARTGRGLISHALIWGGVLLLVVGSVLLYPYARSRLVRLPSPAATPPPPPPTPTASFLPLIAPPTATAVISTSTSDSPSAAPRASTATAAPTPVSTPAPPTRIVIPEIGVDAPVVTVSLQTVEMDGQTQAVWDVPATYAGGWHDTSAPLGVAGNTVLNGHNTANGEVFRDLYTLEIGDTVTVYSGDTPYTYAVSEILLLPEAGQPLEVRLDNARYILPTADERLTLVTCHPYGSLRYRLIVIAHPASGS